MSQNESPKPPLTGAQIRAAIHAQGELHAQRVNAINADLSTRHAQREEYQRPMREEIARRVAEMQPRPREIHVVIVRGGR